MLIGTNPDRRGDRIRLTLTPPTLACTTPTDAADPLPSLVQIAQKGGFVSKVTVRKQSEAAKGELLATEFHRWLRLADLPVCDGNSPN